MDTGRNANIETTYGSTVRIANMHPWNGPKPRSSLFTNDEQTMTLQVNVIIILRTKEGT